MRILGFDHVQLAIPAGGEDEARAFWVDLLGLQEVPKPAALAGRGGAWFTSVTVAVHVGIDPDFHAARKAHPALVVEGIEELLAACRDAGIRVVDAEPLDGRARAHVFDPFGNRIELIAVG